MFKTNIKKTINIPERCKGGEEEIEKHFEFLVRMFLLYLDVSSPKIIYHFNAIPINNKVFFIPLELGKLILQFIWKNKHTRKTWERNRVWGEGSGGTNRLAIPDIKTYDEVYTLQTVWYWYMNRWNRTESPEKNLTHMVIQNMIKVVSQVSGDTNELFSKVTEVTG